MRVGGWRAASADTWQAGRPTPGQHRGAAANLELFGQPFQHCCPAGAPARCGSALHHAAAPSSPTHTPIGHPRAPIAPSDAHTSPPVDPAHWVVPAEAAGLHTACQHSPPAPMATPQSEDGELRALLGVTLVPPTAAGGPLYLQDLAKAWRRWWGGMGSRRSSGPRAAPPRPRSHPTLACPLPPANLHPGAGGRAGGRPSPCPPGAGRA